VIVQENVCFFLFSRPAFISYLVTVDTNVRALEHSRI